MLSALFAFSAFGSAPCLVPPCPDPVANLFPASQLDKLNGQYVGTNGPLLGLAMSHTLAISMTFDNTTHHFDIDIPAIGKSCKYQPYGFSVTSNSPKNTWIIDIQEYPCIANLADDELITLKQVIYNSRTDTVSLDLVDNRGPSRGMLLELPKAPKLYPAVFEGAKTVAGKKLTGTMKFNSDSTMAVKIPAINLDCKNERYLVEASGQMWMDFPDVEPKSGAPGSCIFEALRDADAFLLGATYSAKDEAITIKAAYNDDKQKTHVFNWTFKKHVGPKKDDALPGSLFPPVY